MRSQGFLGLYGFVMANFIGTSDYQIFGLSKQMRYLPYKFYSPLLPKFSDQKNATHFFLVVKLHNLKQKSSTRCFNIFCSQPLSSPQKIPQTLPIQSAIHPNGGVPCGDRPVEWAYGPYHCIARKLNGAASDAGRGKSLANRNWDLDTAGNSFFRNG